MRLILALSLLGWLTGFCQALQNSESNEANQVAVESISHRIDELINLKLAQAGWAGADPCSDSSFVRRAYLDLTGHPPKAAEVQKFVEDGSASKRNQLLLRLLNSPAHADHLAAIWSGWLTPERDDVPVFDQGQNALQTWLRSRFAENLRYDRLVADLLIASGPTESGPTSFFVALESKPEKIATQTARIFMGVQLDCAQCHDHPFDQWKQKDFWGFAAYFAQISSNGDTPMRGSTVVDQDKGEVMLPNTQEVVAPKPLVKTELISARGTRRQQLTLWLTTRDNPFLARATVNRIWAMFMGRGLVEPIDDMRAEHPATHPELLEELSSYFTNSGYDLRRLILAITQTEAYSRSTRHNTGNTPEELYATMLAKPLTERQIANSVSEVARQLGSQTQQNQQLIRQLGKLRGEASQSKLGIVSALVTLHGDLLDQASSEKSSRLLRALQAPHLDRQGQIRWMFLTVLCRAPTQLEQQRIYDMIQSQLDSVPASQVEGTESPQDRVKSAELSWQSDLLWALLNSSEFAMIP